MRSRSALIPRDKSFVHWFWCQPTTTTRQTNLGASPSLALDALELVLDPDRGFGFGFGVAFKFGFGVEFLLLLLELAVLSSGGSSGGFLGSSFRTQMMRSRSCLEGPALWLRFL